MVLNRHVVGKYELGKVLGAGDFDSRTRLCTHTETKETFAVKIYDKLVLAESRWMWNQVRESVHIMRSLPKHEHLIETIECFETHSSLYILMQMHSPRQVTKIYTAETYTDLDGSVHAGPPNINVTSLYFSQAVKGILHLHSHKVVHLGLAPDHVMINGEHHLRVGFLVSCKSNTKGYLSDLHGTTHTVAPEVLAGEPYDPELADAWALGVLLYFMVSGGRYPHDSANTIKHILAHNIRPLPSNVDKRAKELIYGLLAFNPAKRLPVSKIPFHPFLSAVKGIPGGATAADDGAQPLSSQSKQQRQSAVEWLDMGAEGASSGATSPSVAPLSRDDTVVTPFGNTVSFGGTTTATSTPMDSPSKGPLIPRPPPRGGGLPTRSSEGKQPLSPKAASSGGTGGGAGSPQEGTSVDSVWDSQAKALIITLPNAYFPPEQEAAYLIQHTWKLYKLRSEEHWDIAFPEGVPMGQLLVIRRVDVPVAVTPESARRFSRGVSLFAASVASRSSSLAGVGGGGGKGGGGRQFSMFGAHESSHYFQSTPDSPTPVTPAAPSSSMPGGGNSLLLSSFTAGPNMQHGHQQSPAPHSGDNGATGGTSLPMIRGAIGTQHITAHPPSSSSAAPPSYTPPLGNAPFRLTNNPFQCTSCGRLPPPRSSTKGGKPYPDTPYEYSSRSGDYAMLQVNTAEKRAEATYQNERRLMLKKRASMDGAAGGGGGGSSQRPTSSSSSSGGAASAMKWYP